MSELKLSEAAGYFHWSPFWVDEPSKTSDMSDWNDNVFYTTLNSGINARVLRHGIFIFDFSNATIGTPDYKIDLLNVITDPQNWIYKRIAILNAHLVCLYTAVNEYGGIPSIPKMIVTPLNMLTYQSFSDLFPAAHPKTYVSAQLQYAKSLYSSSNGLAAIAIRQPTLPLATIERSFSLLNNILQHPSSDALDLVHLYARSCKSNEDHDYNLTLITSWTIVEKLLSTYWNNYHQFLKSSDAPVTEKQDFEVSRTNLKLKNRRSYTVHQVIELLYDLKRIPSSLRTTLNEVKEARNAWMHNLQPIDVNMARKAIYLASDMLRLIYGLHFNMPFDLSMLF